MLPEEVPVVPDDTSFSVLKVDYFLNNEDGMDSTLYQFKSYQLRNYSSSQIQETYYEDFQGLNKKSLFTLINRPENSPKDLNLSALAIPTPTQIGVHQIYSVNLGWKLSDTLQLKPYEYRQPGNQVVNIPANSSIQIDRSIKEYWANVSFSAKVKNEKTGELHTITGKWRGTLHFSNYSVSLSQKTLKLNE